MHDICINNGAVIVAGVCNKNHRHNFISAIDYMSGARVWEIRGTLRMGLGSLKGVEGMMGGRWLKCTCTNNGAVIVAGVCNKNHRHNFISAIDYMSGARVWEIRGMLGRV